MNLQEIRELLDKYYIEAHVKHYEEALRRLNELLSCGDNVEAIQLRGIAKYFLDDAEGALEDFNKADAIKPDDAFTISWRGNTKRMLEDDSGALEDFNRADQITPDDAFTLSRRGFLNYETKDYNGALEDLNRANELRPNDARILRMRGEVKRMLRNFNEALQDLNRADELQPNDAYILYIKGATRYMLDDYHGALEDLNAAYQISPNESDILQSRGKTKNMLKDYKGALEDLNKANQIQPNNARTLRHRAVAKRRLGDFGGALEDLIISIDIEPNNAYTLRNRGITYRLLNEFVKSLEDLNTANDFEPNNADTLSERGLTKYWLGNYRGALEDFNKADELRPNNAFTLELRGITKCFLEDNIGALEDFNKVSEIDHNITSIYSYRGASKVLLGDYNGGLTDLNRAYQIDPNDIGILRARGEAKRNLQQYEEALVDFDEAERIEHGPETLMWRSIIKYHLYDYNGALDDINTALAGLKGAQNVECSEWKQKIEQRIKSLQIPLAERIDQYGSLEIVFKDLVIKEKIGEGGFGEVVRAEWRGIKVAIKKLKKTVAVNQLPHEAKTLILMRYKYIVTLIGMSKDPTTKELILVMEYMKHGSLEALLFKQNVKLSRQDVVQIALDIAKGINFLHSQRPIVIHRDLKCENVLLHSGKKRAKIADFGTAKFLSPSVQATTMVGAFGLAAPPEMLASKAYNQQVDVFNFGVILYEMHSDTRMPILEEKDRRDRIRSKITSNKDLAQLASDCCKSDPNKRPTIKAVIEKLKKIKKKL